MDPTSAVPAATLAPECGDPLEYLRFRGGEERYAIDILRAQEIRGFERPTRVAGASDFGAEADAGDVTGLGRTRIDDHDALLIVVDIGLAAMSRRH